MTYLEISRVCAPPARRRPGPRLRRDAPAGRTSRHDRDSEDVKDARPTQSAQGARTRAQRSIRRGDTRRIARGPCVSGGCADGQRRRAATYIRANSPFSDCSARRRHREGPKASSAWRRQHFCRARPRRASPTRTPLARGRAVRGARRPRSRASRGRSTTTMPRSGSSTRSRASDSTRLARRARSTLARLNAASNAAPSGRGERRTRRAAAFGGVRLRGGVDARRETRGEQGGLVHGHPPWPYPTRGSTSRVRSIT